MRKLLVGIALLSLGACGGGDSGGGAGETTYRSVGVVNSGNTIKVNEPETVNLTVVGSGNTINVATPIHELSVVGSNNLIIFDNNVDVAICDFNGSDNTIQKPAAMTISCDNIGSGNQIIDS